VGLGEGGTLNVAGGMAAVERSGENYYLLIPLRNVGTGLAVLQSWHITAADPRTNPDRPEPAEFRPQTRDLYVPAGDTGFWQGAVREPVDPFRDGLGEAIAAGEVLTVDLLYGDHEGGQRTIARFVIAPWPTEDDRPAIDSPMRAIVVRYWTVDGHDPR
jgi:hypothetical protein